MGNIIGQAMFGWMFPHPAPVPIAVPAPAAPTPAPAPAQKIVNNTASSTNNPAQQFPYQAQQFNSTQIK
jgi:hypothetical protein